MVRIGEARTRKIELAERIAQLCRAFEEETGVKVRSIELSRSVKRDGPGAEAPDASMSELSHVWVTATI